MNEDSENISGLNQYQDRVIGSSSLSNLIKYELIISFLDQMPGGIGILLRKKLYKSLFKKTGKNVLIGGFTSINAVNHIFKSKDKPIKEQDVSGKGIIIEDDVWLGTGVRVLDGVKISEEAFIGAGAVVTKNIDSYAVAVGLPAKVIRYRE